jgi:hypothetical protein
MQDNTERVLKKVKNAFDVLKESSKEQIKIQSAKKSISKIQVSTTVTFVSLIQVKFIRPKLMQKKEKPMK